MAAGWLNSEAVFETTISLREELIRDYIMMNEPITCFKEPQTLCGFLIDYTEEEVQAYKDDWLAEGNHEDDLPPLEKGTFFRFGDDYGGDEPSDE